jgi:hypothetical protein
VAGHGDDLRAGEFRAARTAAELVPARTGFVNHWRDAEVVERGRDQSVEWTSSSCEVLAMVSSFSIRPDRR